MSFNRRQFLVASSSGFAGLQLGNPKPVICNDSRGSESDPGSLSGTGKAKSVILFFLCGGASHIDTWDMKPDAPSEYRGPFSSIGTSSSGIRLCEHLPMLARQTHHLAIVNSVCSTVNTNDHHAGYYYNLTGHVPDNTFKTQGNDRRPYSDDWPFMGSVVSSRRSNHDSLLHGAITLPHMPSRRPYTRPGQFAARLGIEFDPLYVDGTAEDGDTRSSVTFQAPSLVLSGDVTKEELVSLLQAGSWVDGTDTMKIAEEKNWDHQSIVGAVKSLQGSGAITVEETKRITLSQFESFRQKICSQNRKM